MAQVGQSYTLRKGLKPTRYCDLLPRRTSTNIDSQADTTSIQTSEHPSGVRSAFSTPTPERTTETDSQVIEPLAGSRRPKKTPGQGLKPTIESKLPLCEASQHCAEEEINGVSILTPVSKKPSEVGSKTIASSVRAPERPAELSGYTKSILQLETPDKEADALSGRA